MISLLCFNPFTRILLQLFLNCLLSTLPQVKCYGNGFYRNDFKICDQTDPEECRCMMPFCFSCIIIYICYCYYIGSEIIGNLNILRKTKMFDFEERVLIVCLANTLREPDNQDAYLKVHHFYFYVKVAYHFRPEYNRAF